jgi:hypothetical protein
MLGKNSSLEIYPITDPIKFELKEKLPWRDNPTEEFKRD